MAWLRDVEDCDECDQLDDGLGDVDPGVLLTHEVDVAHRQVLKMKNDQLCKFAQLCRCTGHKTNEWGDGLGQIYTNWDLADDVPSVVALGVVPRQPVVEEVVEEGCASLLAEPGTKSPLKQNPTGKYKSSLKHSRIWSNEEIKASIMNFISSGIRQPFWYYI